MQLLNAVAVLFEHPGYHGLEGRPGREWREAKHFKKLLSRLGFAGVPLGCRPDGSKRAFRVHLRRAFFPVLLEGAVCLRVRRGSGIRGGSLG